MSEPAPLTLGGLHHVTAVTADARGNHRFYTQLLGLRLVKRTVNQDDVSAYHLFYADGAGSPGSDMTFFDWPVGRERRGTRSIVRTGLRVRSEDSLGWWRRTLNEQGVTHGPITDCVGRRTLELEDPEGQRLALVVDETTPESHPWERSPVPPEHQILGLGPVTISVPDLPPTATVLTEVMGMRSVGSHVVDGGRLLEVFAMGAVGPAAELHVLVEPESEAAYPGAGGVHHVAFRIPDADHHAWAEHLQRRRIGSSGPVDRHYFKSLYFREPSGILFEIATNGPGFTVDESASTIGEKLSLPPLLEPSRQAIEAGLRPL